MLDTRCWMLVGGSKTVLHTWKYLLNAEVGWFGKDTEVAVSWKRFYESNQVKNKH
jgi:hypothetical protein